MVAWSVPAALNPDQLPVTGEEVREQLVAWTDRNTREERLLSVRWQPLRRHGERTQLSTAVLLSYAELG